MTRFDKVFLPILGSIVLVGGGFVGGYCYSNTHIKPKEVIVEKVVEKPIDLEMPGEVEKRKVTVEEVESKLNEMAELTTYSGDYTISLGKEETRYLFEKYKIPGTTNSITITATGIVKVGYDVKEIKVNVENFKIFIKIPNAKLNDNYVIWDTVESNDKNNIFNPIEFEQYKDIVDEIEKKGLEDVVGKGIYERAEDNLKKIISGFMSEFVDYELVFM